MPLLDNAYRLFYNIHAQYILVRDPSIIGSGMLSVGTHPISMYMYIVYFRNQENNFDKKKSDFETMKKSL